MEVNMYAYYDPKTDPRTDESKKMLYPDKDRFVPSKVFLGKPHEYGICDRSKVPAPNLGE